MYLNSVYFGRDAAGGIAGVAEASRRFFGVPVDSLSLDQCRAARRRDPRAQPVLAVSPPGQRAAPAHAWCCTTWSRPARSTAPPRRAAAAQPLRLRRAAAAARALPVVPRLRAPGARSRAAARRARGLGPHRVHDARPGVAAARPRRSSPRACSTRSSGAGAAGPARGRVRAAGRGDGEVRALVGGRDPGNGDFNRATMALRQPGSAIKPIVYSAALDSRRGRAAHDPGDDGARPAPRRSTTPEGPWKPRNDEGEYHETVTLAKALAKSLNLATANLVEKIGAGHGRALRRALRARPARRRSRASAWARTR